MRSLAGSGACSRFPGVAWLSVFFLVALYAVLCVALGNQDTLGAARARSGTRSTGTSATCSRRCATSGTAGQFLTVFLRTFAYVAIALALSLAIGYPVAYYAARHAGRWRGLVLLAARPAVLDQLPDADAGLDQPALAGRLGHALPARRRHRARCSCSSGC